MEKQRSQNAQQTTRKSGLSKNPGGFLRGDWGACPPTSNHFRKPQADKNGAVL